MALDRRRFIQSSLALAAGAAMSQRLWAACVPQSPAAKPLAWYEAGATKPAEKSLKILFLGGTMFLGPHTVEHALARGHHVTLFNRGRTNPQLFPELEKLRGDRKAGELDALRGDREWDVAIDTCAYLPRAMRQSTELLKGRVGHYVVVSSVNAYSSDKEIGQDEAAPTHTKWPEEGPVTEEAYGPMKRGCEAVLEELMPGRSATVRPSLIIGPRDPSDRFTYWPLRCRRGGEFLAPVGPREPVQVIDARDLGRFLVRVCELKLAGAYNATGAAGVTFGPMLAACMEGAAARAGTGPLWAPWKFLKEQRVEPWTDLPVWIPSEDPEQAGLAMRSGSKAARAGFQARPLALTVRDTLAWWDSLPEARRAQVRSGLTADREAELLGALRATKTVR